MLDCRRCGSMVPAGAWWCPACGARTSFAPRGAHRHRPADLLPTGALRSAAGLPAPRAPAVGPAELHSSPLSSPVPSPAPGSLAALLAELTPATASASGEHASAPPREVTFGSSPRPAIAEDVRAAAESPAAAEPTPTIGPVLWPSKVPAPPVPPSVPISTQRALPTTTQPIARSTPFQLDPQWRATYLRKLKAKHRRRRMYASLSFVGVLVAVAAITNASAPRTRPGHSVTVLLQYAQSQQGTSFNAPPTVLVTVGHNHAIPVVLDTGSVGLRVFSNTLTASPAAGVASSKQADVVNFADGSLWNGTVATAVVRIGGIATTSAVPFELVTSVSCDRSHPQCPSLGGLRTEEREQFNADGVLGVGLVGPASGDPTVNPLSALPGDYGRLWDIDLANSGNNTTVAGTLTLDPTIPQQSPTVIPLDPLGYAGDVPLWDDAPDLCWTIGTDRTCSQTLFDSGSSLTVVGSQDVRDPTVPAGAGEPVLVTGGLPVSVSLPGESTSFWSFETGGEPGKSAVEVVAGKLPLINTGVAAFFSLDLRYDLTMGTISLTAPYAPVP